MPPAIIFAMKNNYKWISGKKFKKINKSNKHVMCASPVMSKASRACTLEIFCMSMKALEGDKQVH